MSGAEISVKQPEEKETTILVVDDNPTNLDVVFGYLEGHGFTVLVARDGLSGLQKAEYAQPDIILLDVMMPGINGFETCKRLKTNPQTAEIPVIFMTALADTENKVRGFSTGAVDYVTKPLHQAELLARIKTHLQIRTLARSLQEANQSLARLNADKDRFFSIVAHDLRGPFAPLLLRSEMLARRIDRLEKEKVQEIGRSIHQSAKQIANLLDNLLHWARLQMGRTHVEPYSFELKATVDQNIKLLTSLAEEKKITLENQLQQEFMVFADRHMLETILRNLLSNAIKFTRPGGQVSISIQPDYSAEQRAVMVVDNGQGIEPEDIAKLFQIGQQFSTPGTAQERGTGLGLILCQEMIQRNGGQIWIESQVGQGTTVTFTIPKSPSETN